MNEKDIVDRLDILISLMIPKFDASNYDVKGLGLEIMKLCDASYTVQDMCKELDKPRQIIDNALSKLRSKELVKTISKDGKTVYVRLK
jgi:DNA-binding transcriptional ArsR family regulator